MDMWDRERDEGRVRKEQSSEKGDKVSVVEAIGKYKWSSNLVALKGKIWQLCSFASVPLNPKVSRKEIYSNATAVFFLKGFPVGGGGMAMYVPGFGGY